MVGLPYLFKTLARPLFDLHQELEDQERMAAEREKMGEKNLGSVELVIRSSEINPDKIKDANSVDINLNVLDLQLKCQKLLSQIVRSDKILPSQLAEVLTHVKGTIEKHFPKSTHIAFGNFLFLRFISPAIVSPEGFSLANGIIQRMNKNRFLFLKFFDF